MVLERIKQFIDYKHVSVSAFEKSIGMANASFGKSLKKGGSIGVDKLENILKIYPELSAEWLLRDIGPMLLSTEYPTKDAHIDYLEKKVAYYESLVRELDQHIGMLKKELEFAGKGETANIVDGSSVAHAG